LPGVQLPCLESERPRLLGAGELAGHEDPFLDVIR
jgi:hypothetical protein